jgi:ADP-ribosyl-[dinitrogen reductase] hydrolase
MQDRFRGCLLGLAVGDAVGTTVEFKRRGSFTPFTDMVGGGPFNLKPGQWTDDTSMALCLAESLVLKQGFDPRDQMARYVRWYRKGYLSSTGRCFDIGATTSDALHRFLRTSEPFSGSTDPRSAGNGSIMRLAPIPMFFCQDAEKAVHYAGESSRTTHGAAECVEACKFYAFVQVKALSGTPKDDILFAPDNIRLAEACHPGSKPLPPGNTGTRPRTRSGAAATWPRA